MAALRQEHRYGLSCGQINKNSPKQSLYHVKLTDTAIRTLETYQNLKVMTSYPPQLFFKSWSVFTALLSFSNSLSPRPPVYLQLLPTTGIELGKKIHLAECLRLWVSCFK